MFRLMASVLGAMVSAAVVGAAPLDFSPVLDRVAAGTRVVIVGEVHGTQETPEAFGQLVSQAVERFGSATVALELPHAGGLYGEFVAGLWDGGRILALPFWARSGDGRQSEAMLRLLFRLRELRSSGADVVLQVFDSRAGYAGQGDAALAEALRGIVADADGRPVLVLTGNLHARKRAGASFDPDFRPMAHRLEDLPNLSLDARFSGGSAWICQPGNDCGPQELGSQVRGEAPGSPGVVLFDKPDERGFDGMVYLGRATASPPAREAQSDRGD